MLHKFSSLTKHTSHLTTFIFVFGFVFDAVMLPDLSHPITRYIWFTHLFIIATLIMFREWLVSRNRASHFEQRVYSIATFGIAFSSGAALSILSIYAIRSADFSVSWPLFILLFICILINEIVSSHSFRFTIDVGILLTATLFCVVFNLPVLLKIQNDITFTVSIIVSMIISFLYLYFLQFTSESASHEAPRSYALAIGIPMFVGMLYFLNVIPAVPLSLASSGVYHNIIHTKSGEFIAMKETDTRSFAYFRTPVFHFTPIDEGVYFFSGVDAPGELTAPISHFWEKYDKVNKKWVSFDEPITFTLAGGRKDGYRAFSEKHNIDEGLWRVTVKVDKKRIIGRVKFKIIRDSTVDLHQVKL